MVMWRCQWRCVCLFTRAGLTVGCGVRLGGVQAERGGERVCDGERPALHTGGGGGGGGGVCDVEAEWRGCEQKQSRNALATSEVSVLSQADRRHCSLPKGGGKGEGWNRSPVL
jgi:hypothetical protein